MSENKLINSDVFSKVQETMLAADKQGMNTRPKISWLMAILVAVFLCAYVIGMLYSVIFKDLPMPTWEEMLVILGVPSALLRSYFGMRSEDKRIRAQVAMGENPSKGTIREAIASRVSK